MSNLRGNWLHLHFTIGGQKTVKKHLRLLFRSMILSLLVYFSWFLKVRPAEAQDCSISGGYYWTCEDCDPYCNGTHIDWDCSVGGQVMYCSGDVVGCYKDGWYQIQATAHCSPPG